MASQDDLLNRLIALVRGLDDSSWEALASKGLLRRARKELEGGLAVSVATEAESFVTLLVPPFEVSMPAAGPARATCTCSAGGVCQHILAAGLYLRSLSARLKARLRRCRPNQFVTKLRHSPRNGCVPGWAREYRAALAVVEKNSLPPVFEWTDSVLVRLMPSAIEARLFRVPGLRA